jgi:transcriptional regulator with XRE-family HTH domain
MPSPHLRWGEVSAFGRVLREWGQKRGYSQWGLALASHVSQHHISFLESGRAPLSRDTVLRLATRDDRRGGDSLAAGLVASFVLWR